MSAHLKDMFLKALLTMTALFALLFAGRTGQRSSDQQIRPPLRFLMFLPSFLLALQALAARLNSSADVLQLLCFRLSSVVLVLSSSSALNSCCKISFSQCASWSSPFPGCVFLLKRKHYTGTGWHLDLVCRDAGVGWGARALRSILP